MTTKQKTLTVDDDNSNQKTIYESIISTFPINLGLAKYLKIYALILSVY